MVASIKVAIVEGDLPAQGVIYVATSYLVMACFCGVLRRTLRCIGRGGFEPGSLSMYASNGRNRVSRPAISLVSTASSYSRPNAYAMSSVSPITSRLTLTE